MYFIIKCFLTMILHLFKELDEMDLEEDKKSLIHREIDKFRDTYKVSI